MTSTNYEERLHNLENKINNLQNDNDAFLSTSNFILVQKGILFFFLIISGNYIGELLSCRTQKLFLQVCIQTYYSIIIIILFCNSI